MKPFLKWAGGKYRLVDLIVKSLGQGNRLIEPFAGSCAVSLNTNYNSYWINDVNNDLISLYSIIVGDDSGFNSLIKCIERWFNNGNNPATYYQARNQFNQEKNLIDKAALFIYLNRHCFNGLCRYNLKGQFNVPFGKYKTIHYPVEELQTFRSKLQNAKFTCCDFRDVMSNADKGDVIYCDPPYVPISKTSNFTAYAPGIFGPADQRDLVTLAEEVSGRGITVVISNHYNEATKELYKNSEMIVFPVNRSISCNANNRQAVEEILAVYKQEAKT